MFRLLTVIVAGALAAAASSPRISAQLLNPNAPVRVGHYHLSVSSLEEHRKFWVDALGGTPARVDLEGSNVPSAAVRFGDVFVLLRERRPTGGTRGTTFDHIGLAVPDVPVFTKAVVAKGYRLTVGREVPGQAPPAQGASAVYGRFSYLLGPDDVKVEIVTNMAPGAPPIAHHHVHFVNPQYVEMGRWYMNVLGATERPGTTDFFFGADLPGIGYMLNFFRWEMPEPLVGTGGRVVDHVGFEVRNLEAFSKTLAAKGVKVITPYSRPATPDGVATLAFLDPWGTVIVLTEGLDKAL
jgi:hypothetical protein